MSGYRHVVPLGQAIEWLQRRDCLVAATPAPKYQPARVDPILRATLSANMRMEAVTPTANVFFVLRFADFGGTVLRWRLFSIRVDIVWAGF